jgi:hypothetical protein
LRRSGFPIGLAIGSALALFPAFGLLASFRLLPTFGLVPAFRLLPGLFSALRLLASFGLFSTLGLFLLLRFRFLIFGFLAFRLNGLGSEDGGRLFTLHFFGFFQGAILGGQGRNVFGWQFLGGSFWNGVHGRRLFDFLAGHRRRGGDFGFGGRGTARSTGAASAATTAATAAKSAWAT